MVRVGELNTQINLDKFYDNIEINDKIKYIEYGSEKEKGEKIKKIKNPRNNKEKKHFYNQITMHIQLDKIVNLKIFKNGRIQMTGIKKEKEHSEKTVEILLNEINNNKNKKEIINREIEDVKCLLLKTALINSDFDMGYKINREMLHRLIIDNGYYSSFESCIYPGVKIKYYYNELLNNKGICNCESKCTGKGINNDCKKITIAVFNSGKIMITGGSSYKHVEIGYKFITDFIKKHEELIKMKEIE